MSKALDYLSKTRPQVTEAYSGFPRANGSSPVPKTRALISVSTKVANRAEANPRHYAAKAAPAGRSSDEIPNTIRVSAIPAPGRSGTVWAAEQSPPVRVAEFDGKSVFVVCRDDDGCTFEVWCPHRGTNPAGCRLNGSRSDCLLHGGRFGLDPGVCIRLGIENLSEFDVRANARCVPARW